METLNVMETKQEGEVFQASTIYNLKRPFAKRNIDERNFMVLLTSQSEKFLKALRSRLSGGFAYRPGVDMIASVMITTGKFDLEKVEENIRQAFTTLALDPDR